VSTSDCEAHLEASCDRKFSWCEH